MKLLHMVLVRTIPRDVPLKSTTTNLSSVQQQNSEQSNGGPSATGPATVSPGTDGLPVPRPLVASASAPLLPNQTWNDVAHFKTSPDKDLLLSASPKLHKARKDRFHKLFPDVAETDNVIKSYHCAYVSDILLQGFLYVTQNWFCFYSKLLGKKRIMISVESVTSITKTKTAIIIPNAVGIVTESNQYVFGSLMSRDNTYRVLCKIWQEKLGDLEKASAIDIDAGSDATVDVDSLADKNLATVSSISGSDDFVTSSSSDDNFCSDVAGSREKLILVGAMAEASCVPSTSTPCLQSDQQSSSTTRLANESPSSATLNANFVHNGVRLKMPFMPLLKLMTWLKSLPRTSLFLLVSTILVLLLLLSAGLLTYKLLHLQAQLDASLRGWSMADDAGSIGKTRPLLSRPASEMYAMRHEYQTSAVQQIHDVLEAHVQLLDQVNEALRGLYAWAVKSSDNRKRVDGHDSL